MTSGYAIQIQSFYREQFAAKEGIQPTANFATWDTRAGASNTLKLVADFDASTIEYLTFDCPTPVANYNSAGLTITVGGYMSSAITGNIILSAQVSRIRSGDAVNRAFTTAVDSAATAVAGSAGNYFQTTIALTDGSQIDSLANGDRYSLMISRKASDAGDTATGDFELLDIEIKETGT